MNKIILYEDGPRILSNRFFCLLFIIPIIVIAYIFNTHLLVSISLVIISVLLLIFSLTALNSGDAIIIHKSSIYSWNRIVKTRNKKIINISEIECIKVDDPYITLKIRNNFEKEYYFNNNQKRTLLRFIEQEQVKNLLK